MTSQGPRVLSLCDRVVLVEWHLKGVVDGANSLTETFGEPIAPLSALRLRDENDDTHVIWALPRPKEETTVFLAAVGGEASTPVEYNNADTSVVGADLFEGLTPASRFSLSSAILGAWSSLFKLQANRSFAQAVATLFKAPPPPKSGIQAMFSSGTGCFLELATSRKLGEVQSGYLVYGDSVRPVRLHAMAHRPTDRAAAIHRLFCELPPGPTPLRLIVKSDAGFLVRIWPQVDTIPRIEDWWRATGMKSFGLREECLNLLNPNGNVGLAASVEFQLRCPLKPSAVTGGTDLPSARIDLALTGTKGMLVGGWYRDPSSFVSGFDVLDHNDDAQSFDADRVDFAGKVPGPDNVALDASGFIAFIPDISGPLQQPRFLLRLRSGVRHLLVPPVQPIDWAAARAAALRAVPPRALSDAVIANCLAPTLSDYQSAAQKTIGKPIVKQIGTPITRPLVSIVIPLYKVLDFLPFQLAAFATDAEILSRCELIYVLDSPEQADVVEHLLTGLHLVYGMPITLAVMSRNGGYSFANNRAVNLARAPTLALVNSDVVPLRGGWLGALRQRLGSDQVGAVGPKLLFEDDSIQHAGLFFSRDHRGRWLNHHYFKGMPRHYQPAERERSVPGITGACMVLQRGLFEKVGGFTEDYVIGDYEDSDLCLKIRAEGRDIVYVPDAELYHLERRSMSQSSDYMRGVASQYNSWLHQQRWGSTMANLMVEYAALAPPPMQAVA